MKDEHCSGHCHHVGGSDGIYGVGVIGALVYFLHGVVGFVPVIVGIVKAFFWPAFIVFKVLTLLNI